MKFVKFRVFPGDASKGEMTVTTRDIIRDVMQIAPQGSNLDDMRKRMRVLDALDAADPTGVSIEDADHKVLVDAVKAFPFVRLSKGLLQICDDIIEAKAPPVVQLPANDGGDSQAAAG
mgnify:CR=1 FL=1